jgi:exopolyphosphatase/guanosine-5'-triphosphate,3'-diphosphate pyrophosphatase
MLGRNREYDSRLDSVKALQLRYAIDNDQANRVESYCLKLFDQVRKYWDLSAADRDALIWACRLHEIGLAIAHSQHHHHGAYLIENTDISGFSKTEQHFIAIIVRNQRRSIHYKSLLSLSEERAVTALRCALLLRLSVLFHRSHSIESIPKLTLQAENNKLTLLISKRWLDKHPLTKADLDSERGYLKSAAINLDIVAR